MIHASVIPRKCLRGLDSAVLLPALDEADVFFRDHVNLSSGIVRQRFVGRSLSLVREGRQSLLPACDMRSDPGSSRQDTTTTRTPCTPSDPSQSTQLRSLFGHNLGARLAG